jgi:hypothetical protein
VHSEKTIMKSIRRHHKKKLKEKRETLLLNLFLTFLFLIFIIDNLLKESQVINQIVRSTRVRRYIFFLFFFLV